MVTACTGLSKYSIVSFLSLLFHGQIVPLHTQTLYGLDMHVDMDTSETAAKKTEVGVVHLFPVGRLLFR